VARGEIAAALDAWADAIHTTQAQSDSASLAEIFEQRRREARRGPGVLQVRSLANRSELPAALVLLERLLADDPQWQPLRSLREQLQTSPAPVPPVDMAPVDMAPVDMAPAATSQPAGIDALLEAAMARLRALGAPMPEQASTVAWSGDLDAVAEHLSQLERRFSDYEARFALN
jgi:hypothetical protein